MQIWSFRFARKNCVLTVVLFEQIGTTKGTGGDVLILEEGMCE